MINGTRYHPKGTFIFPMMSTLFQGCKNCDQGNTACHFLMVQSCTQRDISKTCKILDRINYEELQPSNRLGFQPLTVASTKLIKPNSFTETYGCVSSFLRYLPIYQGCFLEPPRPKKNFAQKQFSYFSQNHLGHLVKRARTMDVADEYLES